jgi:hypothetical protein
MMPCVCLWLVNAASQVDPLTGYAKAAHIKTHTGSSACHCHLLDHTNQQRSPEKTISGIRIAGMTARAMAMSLNMQLTRMPKLAPQLSMSTVISTNLGTAAVVGAAHHA